MESQTLQQEIESARQTIRADSLSMSVGEIANLYRADELVIRPEFQRLFRWEDDQKSRLIESLLLGIPIPSIFVLQRENGIWEVIDGLQRISTILEFMGELKTETGDELRPASVLTSTLYLTQLEGVRYEANEESNQTLSPGQRLALKRAKVDVKVLLPESDERAKFELFDRLNTGGSPLSAQEIRNAQLIMRDSSIYEWLESLRSDSSFQSVITISDRLYDEAYDMELVCRYLALRRSTNEQLKKIGNIDTYLSRKIFETIGDVDFDRKAESAYFKLTFSLLNNTLGEDSFKRNDGGRFLGAFSVSAFETIATGVSENLTGWQAAEGASPGELQRRVIEWWRNTDFRGGSGSGIRASTRLPKTVPAARRFFRK